MNRENTDLLVTIQCLTYNHEPYIRKCLEGFVMQKTNFRFEAIVHDDASTDGTTEIVREYSEKYPDIIKPFFETENQYSKHNGVIGKIIRENTHGKYVAMCEGDDYWIDPLKLQKQVDILENNPDIALCCGGYICKQEGEADSIKLFTRNGEKYFRFSLEDWGKVWYTKTLTVLMRREACLSFYQHVSEYHYGRDIHLIYNLLKWGDGIYITECLGVYNIHSTGICSMVPKAQNALNSYNCYKELFELHHDNFLRKKYISFLMLRMIYEHRKVVLFREGWRVSISFCEKVKLVCCLLPSCFVLFLLNKKNRI